MAAWNGLAITALAEASVVLGEPRYGTAAVAAAELLVTVHGADGDAFVRTSRDGVAGRSKAVLEDHGCVAEAFLAFLLGPEGQGILAEYGFRPVDPEVPDKTGRPVPAKVFTIEDLGGWDAVNRDVFGSKGTWTSTFDDLKKRGR